MAVVSPLNFYRPKHFRAEELVSKAAFQKLGAARVFRYFDPKILMMADKLAELFNFDHNGKKIGSATINNWLWNGNRQYSGLRLPGEPHYKEFSDHSFGRALDIVFSSIDAQSVRDYIEAHPQDFPYITFVEEGSSITWLHISCSNLAGFGHTVKRPDSLLFWDLDDKVIREVLRG